MNKLKRMWIWDVPTGATFFMDGKFDDENRYEKTSGYGAIDNEGEPVTVPTNAIVDVRKH